MKGVPDMKGISAQKLSDDALDQISGGTNREMMQLQDKLGASNLKDIQTGLSDLGIRAKLSSNKENEYKDARTNESLTHAEVMKRIMS